jgi:hypothetical protein
MELRKVDEFQALVAMSRFLEAYWERTGRHIEIGMILSSIGNATPGKTADPALWGDWASAIGSVLAEATAPENPAPSAGTRFDLLTFIADACKRPAMYLTVQPHHEVNVMMLWAFIAGFQTARPSASYQRFQDWIYEQRPDMTHSSMWYGGILLKEFQNDHEKAIKKIGEWLREFRSLEQLRDLQAK